LTDAVAEFVFSDIDIITFAAPISLTELASPNVVKVVKNHQGQAMYFSRSPIPYGETEQALKHIGIYAFRRDILISLNTLDDTLYPSEKLEQIQWVESGLRVMVYACPCPTSHVGISTPEQYQEFIVRHAV
jgi:3-deoxy-manno-octulosonate cytidylyltransferase (CMP-KDO synthetase)